jgi:hypothetical protein
MCSAAGAFFVIAAWQLRMEEFALAMGFLRPKAAALLVRARRRR